MPSPSDAVLQFYCLEIKLLITLFCSEHDNSTRDIDWLIGCQAK